MPNSRFGSVEVEVEVMLSSISANNPKSGLGGCSSARFGSNGNHDLERFSGSESGVGTGAGVCVSSSESGIDEVGFR
jgi:hypothetical protein